MIVKMFSALPGAVGAFPEGCLLRVLRERKQADSFFPTVCVKFINTRCIKPAI